VPNKGYQGQGLLQGAFWCHGGGLWWDGESLWGWACHP